ncbi:MAG: hypothetical protein ACNI3C_06480 [Candidatus Marinarcus sp.]|uniref:hypothetical protein n=1 Tax=Candidatus Marinarcus sp. TaxID=3100987 RepID=UPI003B00CA5C
MLKYLFIVCVLFNLAFSADDFKVSEDVQVNNDECDLLYDNCIVKCDEKDTENTECYSKCEAIYEECLIQKEKKE